MSQKIKRLAFVVEQKEIDAEAGIYETLITTESVDRSKDIVMADGATLDNYMRNPVVQWAHDYRLPPIGKALELDKGTFETISQGKQKGIKSVFQFADWGVHALADTVRRLWAGKYLNATSIGFQPDYEEAEPRTDEEGETITSGPWGFPAYKFHVWDLLEWSIVPIPANQDALRLAYKEIGEELVFSPGEIVSARSYGGPFTLDNPNTESLNDAIDFEPVNGDDVLADLSEGVKALKSKFTKRSE